MITPIKNLNIGDLMKRENDLLVSIDDVKAIAEKEREKTIDMMIYAEKYKIFCNEDECDGTKYCGDCRIKYLNEIKERKGDTE